MAITKGYECEFQRDDWREWRNQKVNRNKQKKTKADARRPGDEEMTMRID